MKRIIAAITYFCLVSSSAIFGAEPNASAASEASKTSSVVAPLTKELQGWTTDGNVKVTDEKGPDGGVVVRMVGKSRLAGEVIGIDPNAVKNYKISFAFRRISPGTDYIGFVQVLFKKADYVPMPPSFTELFPASSTEWTKVCNTFKAPAEIANGCTQIACSEGAIVELADIKLEIVP